MKGISNSPFPLAAVNATIPDCPKWVLMVQPQRDEVNMESLFQQNPQRYDFPPKEMAQATKGVPHLKVHGPPTTGSYQEQRSQADIIGSQAVTSRN